MAQKRDSPNWVMIAGGAIVMAVSIVIGRKQIRSQGERAKGQTANSGGAQTANYKGDLSSHYFRLYCGSLSWPCMEVLCFYDNEHLYCNKSQSTCKSQTLRVEERRHQVVQHTRSSNAIYIRSSQKAPTHQVEIPLYSVVLLVLFLNFWCTSAAFLLSL